MMTLRLARAWGIALILSVPCELWAQGAPSSGVIRTEDLGTWDSTVAVALQQDLWSDVTAYNAGQTLMVPLHAAFVLGRRDWQQEFSDHFGRFATAGFASPTRGANHLARSQYLYLASRFVVLAARAGLPDLIPAGLVPLLERQLEDGWQRDTIQSWGQVFPGGLRERVEWKLNTQQTAHSYLRVIDDLECFQFGIAADLRAYELWRDSTSQGSAIVRDVLEHARRVFEQRVTRQADGGWLFQPGLWSDHPDFLYAGQSEKVPGMTVAPLPDVAEDASHSARFPLWLTSLAGAYPAGAADRRYYEGLRRGLARQFVTHVLVAPSSEFPSYRIVNFMDGRNGVYRWQYQGRQGRGSGPYEMSGSLALGLWAFLDDERVRQAYRDFASRFPLPPEVIRFYVQGPVPAYSHNPQRVLGEAWANGLLGLVVRLAQAL